MIPAEFDSFTSSAVIQPITKASFEASQSFKEDGNPEPFFG